MFSDAERQLRANHVAHMASPEFQGQVTRLRRLTSATVDLVWLSYMQSSRHPTLPRRPISCTRAPMTRSSRWLLSRPSVEQGTFNVARRECRDPSRTSSEAPPRGPEEPWFFTPPGPTVSATSRITFRVLALSQSSTPTRTLVRRLSWLRSAVMSRTCGPRCRATRTHQTHNWPNAPRAPSGGHTAVLRRFASSLR